MPESDLLNPSVATKAPSVHSRTSSSSTHSALSRSTKSSRSSKSTKSTAVRVKRFNAQLNLKAAQLEAKYIKDRIEEQNFTLELEHQRKMQMQELEQQHQTENASTQNVNSTERMRV